MTAAFQPHFVDLVRNYTTTSGTDDFVLGPAVNGYTDVASALQVGETFYYAATGIDVPGEREVGRGTLQAGGVVTRDPFGGARTAFSTGTKSIALIAAAEWYSEVDAVRTTKTNVKALGAVGDCDVNTGIGTDNTAIFQAAIDAIGAAGGGTLVVPDGYYLIDGGCLNLCANLRIEMSAAAYLVTNRAGGGGASPDEDVRNGSMLFSNWPSNGSSAANITIEGGNIACLSADAAGAAFYDNAGSFIKIRGVNVTGFKYAIVFDQTECSDVSDCNLRPTDNGGACVWMVNGPALKSGNIPGFTNRISVRQCQLNAGTTVDLVRDDGGVTHSYVDNNYNGGQHHLYLAGSLSFAIRGGEFEAAAKYSIAFDTTASDGTTGVGPSFGEMQGGLVGSGSLGMVGAYGPATCTFVGTHFTGGGYAITGAGDGGWFFKGCGTNRADREFVDSRRCGLHVDTAPHSIVDNIGLAALTVNGDYVNHRVTCTNPNSNVVTIPNDSTQCFGVGSFIELEQATSTGAASLAGAAGVTITGPTATDGQHQQLKAIKVAPNSWQTAITVPNPIDGSNNLADIADKAATAKNLRAPYVLAQGAVAVAHSGDTAKATLASFTLPANSLGANGQLIIETLFSASATNVNAKNVTVEIGGVVVDGANISSSFGTQLHCRVANRGVPNSQVFQNAGITGYGSNNPQTAAIDTSVDQVIAFTVTLANATDTVKLESYQITVCAAD